MRNVRPIITWTAECYHHISDGDGSTKKYVTHTATEVCHLGVFLTSTILSYQQKFHI